MAVGMVLSVCLCPVRAEEPSKDAATAPEPEKPAATATAAEPAAPESAPARQQWVHGSLGADTDLRWDDSGSDVNLDQSLQLTVTPPTLPHLRLRGLLWMHEDLDSDESRSSVLRDINDAYDSDVRARLLYLYAEFDKVWGNSVLRIGRQRITEGAAFNRMDGAYFKKTYGRGDWYVFGGVRASVYEDTHDDGVFGGGVSYALTSRTRLALDAYYGHENRSEDDEVYPGVFSTLFNLRYPRRVKGDADDSRIALSVWQDINPNMHAYARYTLHDGDSDEVALQLIGYVPTCNFSYELSYRRLLETVEDRASDVTGLYRILGPQQEYSDYLISLHKPLSKVFTLSLEAELHDSLNDDAESGNYDYSRYAAILAADGWLPGVSSSVALSWWDVDQGDGSWSVTGEVSKKWDTVKLSVGTDFERYENEIVRYNPFPYWGNQLLVYSVPGFYQGYMPLVHLLERDRVETHENVRSVYAAVKWSLCTNQDLTTKITYEEDDGPDSPYWRARLAYEIRF